MKNLKNLKILSVTILFISLSILMNYILNLYVQNKRDYFLNSQTSILEAEYKTDYKYFKIMATDVDTMYSQNKKLIWLLSKTDGATKDELRILKNNVYNLLQKNYKRLNNIGISQVHFFLPNNTSFLRMYNPDKFGNDLSQTRSSIVTINKTKKTQEGFEACRYMLGIRFIYPLYNYKKKYLGSVEISYSTQQILKNVTNNFSYDSHILVSKTLLKDSIIEQELKSNYKDTWESKDYYMEESTHKRAGHVNLFKELNTPKCKQSINKNIKSKSAFSIIAKYNNDNVILSFLPILDINGDKNIAYIVKYSKPNYLDNIDIEKNYISIFIYIVIILLYIFSIYVILNQENLKKLALYDNLTKLPNRTLFTIKLTQEMNRASRNKSKVALMFLDLDGFKDVNDRYGHYTGDKLLIIVSNILTKTLRRTDLVARMGGDEFTIILSDITDANMALDISNNIINSINKDIIISKKHIHIGVSIGISLYPDNCNNIEDLIKYADKVMYKSKEAGKNRVTFYSKKGYKNV